LYTKYQFSAPENAGIGGSYVATEDHTLFVDMLLRFCVENTISINAYPTPLNYEHAARGGIGHYALKAKTEQLHSIVHQMRNRVRTCPILEDFQDFFFVVFSHGMKYQVEFTFHQEEPIYQQALQSIGFDLRSDFFRMDKLFVDIALSFLPTPGASWTGLWVDYECVISKFYQPNVLNRFKGTIRKDDFCQFSGLGGFKYSEKASNIVSVQAYSTWKHVFFKRSNVSERQGRDIDPVEVWELGRGFQKWIVRIFITKVC
jgi:hypothetical protein